MLSLKPFEAIPEDIQVHAEARVQANQLTFEFDLKDPNHQVEDLGKTGEWKTWARADELWKTTCFEAFVGFAGDPGYWEFNFSPVKTSWNVYRFEGYRNPQSPKAAADFELKAAIITSNRFKFIIQSKVSPTGMECSLTAVIRTKQNIKYFALTHASTKPDFHQRESFSKRL
jgi:hypothetical protein